jgi:hypothetical protein
MSSGDELRKYLVTTAKGTFDEFINPIGEYIRESSVREPDVLRRLHEVSYNPRFCGRFAVARRAKALRIISKHQNQREIF